MHTRNALDRLEAAGRPLLAAADSLVDAAEEERILGRIFGSVRPAAPARRSRRLTVVLVGVAVLVAASIVAITDAGRGNTPKTGGQHRLALTGAVIGLAGYHFRTPAGFKTSTSPCSAPGDSDPTSASSRFSAAASADGGCVEAFYAISSTGSAIPQGATAVAVGGYQGYLVSQNGSDALSLYVVLPGSGKYWQAALLDARGLTTDQLIAVAESGLPPSP